jgi:diguanylate cyclase (GGDEF)-like protein
VTASAAAGQRRRARWEAVILSTVVLIVVAAGILGLWLTSRQSAFDGFRQRLIDLAREASVSIDPELHARIRNPEQLNGPEYKRAVEPLRRIRRAVPTIHYAYTIVLSGGEVHFVLDAADPEGRTPSGQPEQSGVWEVYKPITPTMIRAFGDAHTPGVATASEGLHTDEWGTFMSGMAPILDASGRQIGVLGLDVDATTVVDRLAKYQKRALLGLAPAGLLIVIAGLLYYRVRCRGLGMEFALIKAAKEDRLTGLPNRTVFMEQLESALQRVRDGEQAGCAVLFFDFDRFKLVNDTLGHNAGDELLRQIARRLGSVLRTGGAASRQARVNLLSRFGGDEFLILLNDLRSPEDAVRVAERLLNALAPSYRILGHEVQSMASVGIVTSNQCIGNAEEVVRNADVAMYEAKRAGRGCSVLFSEAMHERMTRHLAIETSLRRAMGTSELHLRYEPVIELQTGRRLFVKARLQWDHPTMGAIAPDEFMPIAEESGLMVALGQWALEQACRDMASWRRQGIDTAGMKVSLKVSRSQIAGGDRLADQIWGALLAASLLPGCLQIEISELEVMRDAAGVRRLLGHLGKEGVHFALVEFGAGHGALSILREAPFDVIEVDRSFARQLQTGHEGLAVIGATLSLVRNLGKLSVAAGVDDPAQVAILQSLGCDCATGPLFGEPRSLDGIAASGRCESADTLPAV